jgi:hypothetical protein
MYELYTVVVILFARPPIGFFAFESAKISSSRNKSAQYDGKPNWLDEKA